MFANFYDKLPPWLISSYQYEVTECTFGKKSAESTLRPLEDFAGLILIQVMVIRTFIAHLLCRGEMWLAVVFLGVSSQGTHTFARECVCS